MDNLVTLVKESIGSHQNKAEMQTPGLDGTPHPEHAVVAT